MDDTKSSVARYEFLPTIYMFLKTEFDDPPSFSMVESPLAPEAIATDVITQRCMICL